MWGLYYKFKFGYSNITARHPLEKNLKIISFALAIASAQIAQCLQYNIEGKPTQSVYEVKHISEENSAGNVYYFCIII